MNSKIKENLKKTFFFTLFCSFGLLILISLLSFSSSDNSFFRFDSKLEVSNNYLGLFGSVL